MIAAGTNGSANVAPVISGIPKLKINVGEEFRFAPTAKDASNDPLTFSIVNKPVWASFNTATGVLSGTPSLDNVGLSPKGYVISVSDNKGGRASLSALNTLAVVSSPPLTLFGSAPADGATSIPVASQINLSFSRAVRAGNGNIVISNGAGDVRTIAVTDTSQISFDGSNVTVKPSADLNPATDYFVQVSTGAIRDNAGVNFVGITNTTDINFTTGGALRLMSGGLQLAAIQRRASPAGGGGRSQA